MTRDRDFTPALGRPELTSHYDQVIAIMTRERRWRGRLLAALSPRPGDTIVDLGAGTGTMALLIKAAQPLSTVIGIDPDPVALHIARRKIAAGGHDIELIQASGGARALPDGCADQVVSSLVLHQCSPWAKSALLRNALRLLKPGGRLLVADYGLQRSPLMSMLFRQVRALDGFENTRANKNGKIPALIGVAGFTDVSELEAINTPTGSISIYSGLKPHR